MLIGLVVVACIFLCLGFLLLVHLNLTFFPCAGLLSFFFKIPVICDLLFLSIACVRLLPWGSIAGLSGVWASSC